MPLTAAEGAQLADARDHHAKASVRERAAALLKVAAGQSVRPVALHGCLKPRDPEAVGGWVRRFRQGGVAGLLVRPGRGRPPAFSPSARPA